MSLFKQLRALQLPFAALVLFPAWLLVATRSLNIGWSLPAPLNLLPVLAGLAFLALGLILLVQTIALFSSEGQGTLAPWDPPQKLVVDGVYRSVRNPMISGVIAALLGETLLFGSPALAVLLAIFALVNFIYMPLVEEPGLERRFGDDYRRYKQNVPRWLPRRSPWQGS